MANLLVLVDNCNASVKDDALAAIPAARQLHELTILVPGSNCDSTAQIAGVEKVIKAGDAALANELTKNAAPLEVMQTSASSATSLRSSRN